VTHPTTLAASKPGGLEAVSGRNQWLFWACFISLIATSVAFITRLSLLNTWETQFNLNAVQKGEIMGAGIWPFAVGIILFSLVVDKIGYGVAMAFAFICHVVYGIVVICAPLALAPQGASAEQVAAGQRTGYWLLYFGSIVLGLSNGTIEAVINPVVATLFHRQKTKWLNILHAGWPAGLVAGGLLAIALGNLDWRWTIAMIFLPALVYGPMMLRSHFPVNERVAAGGSYMDMLREFGVLAAILVVPLIVMEVGTKFGLGQTGQLIISAAIVIAFGAYVRSPGRFMLFVLMLIMMPLATTEIGTDGWITSLMEEPLKAIGRHPAWVLVYTSLIMMVLRFCAGPIVHRLKPLGLLAASAAVAAVGLYLLSMSVGWAIFAAATLYALGKTFFWPTMLGVVSEQCPRGGALTLNAVGGMGMLAVGVLGGPFIGLLQDRPAASELRRQHPAVYAQVVSEKTAVFGRYSAISPDKTKVLAADQQKLVKDIQESAKHRALATMALFPLVMLVGYLLLMGYFAKRGGYKPVVLLDK
jgi:MFS family permease